MIKRCFECGTSAKFIKLEPTYKNGNDQRYICKQCKKTCSMCEKDKEFCKCHITSIN